MEPRGLISVRLTEEEVRALDMLSISWGLSTRSDTLRSLIERAKDFPAKEEELLTLPPMLTSSLEEMVENGWASSVSEAAARAVDRGLTVLTGEYESRIPRLVGASQRLHKGHVTRRGMGRKGNELLNGTKE